MGWFCDSTWGNPEGCMRYTPFPQRLQPLWLPPYNWSDRRWMHRGGRTVSSVVQKWCIGRSDLAPRHGRHGRHEVWKLFKTVPQRSPRRLVARRSLKRGRGRHTYRRCRRRDADLSTNIRPVKYVYCASFDRTIASVDRLMCRPRQPMSYHGNGSASTMAPLSDLFGLYRCFDGSRKSPRSCCISNNYYNWEALYI